MWIFAHSTTQAPAPAIPSPSAVSIASALKPLRRSCAADFGVRPSRSAKCDCPFGLGREPRQGGLDGFRLDAPASQVETNRSITLSTAREHLRPGDREAAVVDVADLLEPVERLGSLGFAHTALRKPLVELGARTVMMAQQAGCDLDRIHQTRPISGKLRPLSRHCVPSRHPSRSAAGAARRSPARRVPVPGSHGGSTARDPGAP